MAALIPAGHSSASLIACHDCDLLQRDPHFIKGVASCARCGATLYRASPGGPSRALAWTLAAAVLFLIANAFPLVDLDMRGSHRSTTLIGTVGAMLEDGMPLVAALIFFTTIFVPALQLTAMLALLVPFHLRRRLSATGALRWLRLTRSWSMLEVLLLGFLVAVVKLAGRGHVEPGIALWAFPALVASFAAATARFNVHELWRPSSEARD